LIVAKNNMCFVKPQKVKEVQGKKVLLENGTSALCDPSIKTLKKNDRVIVFGNLIIQKL